MWCSAQAVGVQTPDKMYATPIAVDSDAILHRYSELPINVGVILLQHLLEQFVVRFSTALGVTKTISRTP